MRYLSYEVLDMVGRSNIAGRVAEDAQVSITRRESHGNGPGRVKATKVELNSSCIVAVEHEGGRLSPGSKSHVGRVYSFAHIPANLPSKQKASIQSSQCPGHGQDLRV